uniref:Uncharacterized protein n=1 Tax=Ficus carica TaxID=3494 RepID=A0AA88CU26_FICCA|nr:hypothetical protein TIFTF001_047973 [Ficus carica]
MDVCLPGYNDNNGSLAQSKTAPANLKPKPSLYHQNSKPELDYNKENRKQEKETCACARI